ncbi:glycine betaine/proline transport system permease protein [Rhizobium sp. SG_E_25_P2]|jgi:glycine betaine/proline transport system permease protein|uniref:choline ABC transporter permease subunit n=1 Tax=Rhizobium sp. SG_E_25_P2 TaxID=2879942 RepID=UPI002476DAC3|nr:choline ABC transporter permease subunit [Rhizobium sp. SG_E_25_P2]MDH6267047.1 glycine betaine/proline transport system permease protein [Rhizobium sp. SG_E_25_P2]
MNILTEYKIPVGSWAKTVVDWLTTDLKVVFRVISAILDSSINAMLFVLDAPYLRGSSLEQVYPLFMIVVFTAFAWFMRRSVGIAAFTLLGMLFIYNQGYWKETMQTLALVLAATGVCMVIGIPIGIACARRPWLYSAMRPVLDLMQTIPTFVYLIPALLLFGLGMVPGLIATVIFAIPAPIRLTRLGIISTPPSLVEAAEAFGATKRQVLTKVELPFAMPQIMAGLTQTIMLSLSMVVIAALVGANGLGVPVVRALNTVNIAKGFDSGLCIVILAIVLDRIFRSSDEGDA